MNEKLKLRLEIFRQWEYEDFHEGEAMGFVSKRTASEMYGLINDLEKDVYSVQRKSGLFLGTRELEIGDVIQYRYPDKMEKFGYGVVEGVVVFENGCFVVKEIDFDGYLWTDMDIRPQLLYDWLRDNPCKYTGNIASYVKTVK